MIGRGAYGRPWFLRQVMDYLADGSRTPAPGLARRVEIMLEHYEVLLMLYGRHTGVRVARKHLGWYAKGIDGAADFRARMNGEDDPARVPQMIRALFAPAPGDTLDGMAPETAAAWWRRCPSSP